MEFSYRFDKKELQYGLRNLSFTDNFDSHIIEDVTVGTSGETKVVNPFRDNRIPKYYFVISQTGDGILNKGDTDWDTDNLYFKNVGDAEITVTIIVLGER